MEVIMKVGDTRIVVSREHQATQETIKLTIQTTEQEDSREMSVSLRSSDRDALIRALELLG